MWFERALFWVAVLAGGLSPILVSFVALIIGRSLRRKLYHWTLANQWNRADRGTGLTILARQSRSGFYRLLYCPFRWRF
jgi:hypothetical protein